MFEAYLSRWHLTPDGAPIVTRSSRLLPVRHDGRPAMLKLAIEEEEQRGGAVMAWWDGRGAARVLAHDEFAVLLERATGAASLVAMARAGHDDEASRILCATAVTLHAPLTKPPPPLLPLAVWCAALLDMAGRFGGVLGEAAATARELLRAPCDVVVLHGDLHHGNVLDAGARGWLAVDPKGLLGERTFEFATIFCNPEPQVATAPGRLARQAAVVAQAAGLEPVRLLRWVLAHAGLSAAWMIEDGEDPQARLQVAAIAAAALANMA